MFAIFHLASWSIVLMVESLSIFDAVEVPNVLHDVG